MTIWNTKIARLLHEAGMKYHNTPSIHEIVLWIWNHNQIWISVYPSDDEKWTASIINVCNKEKELIYSNDSIDHAYIEALNLILPKLKKKMKDAAKYLRELSDKDLFELAKEHNEFRKVGVFSKEMVLFPKFTKEACTSVGMSFNLSFAEHLLTTELEERFIETYMKNEGN